MTPTPSRPQRTLCLGEALVDFICERPIADFSQADAFVPHVGGATANVTVSAARHGGLVGLAGAVGTDWWGSWLRGYLDEEGVDLTWLRTLVARPTPIACIVLNSEGEPTFTIYGESIGAAMEAIGDRIEDAVAEFDGLFFASNTLAGEAERRITLRAREAALSSGRPVIIDANLRLERWAHVGGAVEAVLECVPGAHLVRTNRSESELLTGCADPEDAAHQLLARGAQAVVVSLGADGAILRGPHSRTVAGIPSKVRSTVGAGDALTGVLVAALTCSGYDIGALVDALPVAVAEAARATERWGAVETKASAPR